MLIGGDDMDLFKGIELKLAALERVLDYHPVCQRPFQKKVLAACCA